MPPRQLGQRHVVAIITGVAFASNAAACVRRGPVLRLAPVLAGDALALAGNVRRHQAVKFGKTSPSVDRRIDLFSFEERTYDWLTLLKRTANL